MPDSMGINRETGKAIYDGAHVVQSAWLIFTTPIGTRVMLRTFGSAIPALLGRENLTERTLAIFWAAVLAAIDSNKNQYGADNGEPRFVISKVNYPVAGNSPEEWRKGHFEFAPVGTYYPLALQGNYSVTAPLNQPFTFPFRSPQ